MPNINQQLFQLIMEVDPEAKRCGVQALTFSNAELEAASDDQPPQPIAQPGYPSALALVAPRDLPRRGIQAQTGRNILMHSIAHIEYNAIHLALDAAYRFRQQAVEFYQDWLFVARDEARHFGLVNDYLKQNDCEYGAYPAHNGLWSMTVQTAHDVLDRMALVPRVLEARGLDVSPAMIKRLDSVGDTQAADILRIIYQDEIEHVRIGSKWFNYHCEQRGIAPRIAFQNLIKQHFHGVVRGPFNIAARLQAGFDQQELDDLINNSK
ncbi:ferritin-like domain-containing protein [Arenicella xantha]|uniref:Uncharacterized ferritin-like protein (DUF455 family) n=1 Tax=Arenicella xantha TaxID=644221 RepID=A0A395JML4_9GAMM|nr:ferritin-like domain-containing protein [Arenicella xantha]RBP52789.1 uncharacterized ferritin-like protein (DUF455 family) [Arenicella xantha]